MIYGKANGAINIENTSKLDNFTLMIAEMKQDCMTLSNYFIDDYNSDLFSVPLNEVIRSMCMSSHGYQTFQMFATNKSVVSYTNTLILHFEVKVRTSDHYWRILEQLFS